MRILFFFLCLLMPAAGYPIDWFTPNEDTIAWDAVSSPSGQAVSYKIYLAPYGDPDSKQTAGGVVGGNPTVYTVTIPEGAWMVGISTVYNAGRSDAAESQINWSVENGPATPNPFAWDTPVAPGNLRRQ